MVFRGVLVNNFLFYFQFESHRNVLQTWMNMNPSIKEILDCIFCIDIQCRSRDNMPSGYILNHYIGITWCGIFALQLLFSSAVPSQKMSYLYTQFIMGNKFWLIIIDEDDVVFL